ncbi:MAG TPA: hypothetical protein VGM90_16795 [Kofleriaceae bacterium]|jgi:alkylation response protein AidB-like acyl-CoA dehydrogenase
MTLLEHARGVATLASAHRGAHEAAKQLSPEVVGALRETELLAVLAPTELGGHQTAPVDYIDVLSALAAGDPATAWCVMTCSTSTLLAPYFTPTAAEALWNGKRAPFIAGVFAPMGKLAEDGTLRGRWSYTSGCRHADIIVVGALSGTRHVVCALPASAVTVIDNWDTLGLGGTGSHDVAIEAAIDPDRVTSVFERRPWSTAPLYRVPLFGLLAIGIAGCALGIAEGSLAMLRAKLDDKAASVMLAQYGELHAMHAAARAYLRDVATSAYSRAAGSDAPLDAAMRGELRIAATHVAVRCADVVRGAFRLGGGASARRDSTLGASLRDIETLLTHRMIVDRVVPAAARAVVGIGTPPPDL